VMVTLPDRIGAKWYPLIDTSKPSPYDFLTDDVPNIEVALAQTSSFLSSSLYPMINYSAIVLVLKDENIF
jgi:isoamylase